MCDFVKPLYLLLSASIKLHLVLYCRFEYQFSSALIEYALMKRLLFIVTDLPTPHGSLAVAEMVQS